MRPQALGEAESQGRGQCWEVQGRAEAICPPCLAAPADALRASESSRVVGLVGTQHPSVFAVPTG